MGLLMSVSKNRSSYCPALCITLVTSGQITSCQINHGPTMACKEKKAKPLRHSEHIVALGHTALCQKAFHGN